jgi:hypothetical protein
VVSILTLFIRQVRWDTLFLLSYEKEEGVMFFFLAWEAARSLKSGWRIMTGKVDKEDKNRIELRSDYDLYPSIIQIRNKDNIVLRSPSGYDADMKKIGIIKVP